MGGRNKWRDLVKPIYENPVRRARVEELGCAYDALLAGAEAGLSDEEVEEPRGNPARHRPGQRAGDPPAFCRGRRPAARGGTPVSRPRLRPRRGAALEGGESPDDSGRDR